MLATASVKKNFVLNLIYTISGILFPLITFPYISRILFAEGIGKVQFYSSIVEYIILLTSIGIPLYAVREIARVRNDRVRMSETMTEILLLHTILSVAGYMLVFVLINTVAKIQADIPLFLLLSTSIFFKVIGVEWFYNGIEDFKYITIRSIIIRVLSLIALFVFVREKDDLYYYAAISVAATVGNNVFNFVRLRRYINLSDFGWRGLQIGKHFKPALKVFVLNLIISLYIHLDTIMLGFFKDEAAVGYYTASVRVSRTLTSVVASLGVVLLPRLSNLVSSGSMEEFRSLSQKSIDFITGLSLPLTVGVIFMASPVIHLFCGNHFEPSVITLQLMAPIILFISISGIYNLQILYALNKEKLAIISASFGAVVNLTLNFILIPYYSQYGAAVATLFAELIVVISTVILGKRYIPINLFSREKITYYLATLLIVVLLFSLRYAHLSEIVYLAIGTIASVFIYILFLVVRKDSLITQIMQLCISKYGKNEH